MTCATAIRTCDLNFDLGRYVCAASLVAQAWRRFKKGQSACRSAAHLSKAVLGSAVNIGFVACRRWHKGHFRRIEGIGDEFGSLH